MAKGYWIVHITVTDPENYPKYLAADAIAFEKYQAAAKLRQAYADSDLVFVEGQA